MTGARQPAFSGSAKSILTIRRLPTGADFPFHQVSKADAWIDDPTRPDYNQFVTIDDPENPPPWFAKEKMRHNDFAYRWLVEIRHNSDPPLPNEGSAIFFHIRRGTARPTSGCTTMAESDLVRLITWLRADRHPCYVLLPRNVYAGKERSWNLPALADSIDRKISKIPATEICITERLTLR